MSGKIGYVRHDMPQLNTAYIPSSLVYPARVVVCEGNELRVDGRAGHALLATSDGALADDYCAYVNGALADRHEPDDSPVVITLQSEDGGLNCVMWKVDERGYCLPRGLMERTAADEDAVAEALLRQGYELTDISPDGWVS